MSSKDYLLSSILAAPICKSFASLTSSGMISMSGWPEGCNSN